VSPRATSADASREASSLWALLSGEAPKAALLVPVLRSSVPVLEVFDMGASRVFVR
jgi:hypothetical protein